MSALPPKADMLIVGIDVCYVPIADIIVGSTRLSLVGRPLAISSLVAWAHCA